LSSLFLLFIGLTDRLIIFRQTLPKTPWTATGWTVAPRIADTRDYGKKYIRQGMLIATWALFILSSFEWSGPVPSLPTQNQQETTESIQIPVQKVAIACTAPYHFDRYIPSIKNGGIICLSPLFSPQLTAKTWLRLCVLRI
jgi:hypothetical protein